MSIYIKNMEMPKSCLRGGCPIAGDSCSLWEDKYWKSPDEPYRKRHQKCPLVLVPGHGRLIDADVLEKEAQKRILICSKNDNQFQQPYEIMRAIALAPTVIPAEPCKEKGE